MMLHSVVYSLTGCAAHSIAAGAATSSSEVRPAIQLKGEIQQLLQDEIWQGNSKGVLYWGPVSV